MFILYSFLLMTLLSALLGFMLAVFSKIFEVKVDPRITLLTETLPNYNCGACGYPGCAQYAEAIINSNAPIDKCAPGGPDLKVKISEILKNNSN